tara:strand:- start:271 stop:1203 length:933 start_codon:yes stop_codon:yes gene_type:complete
MKTKPIDEIIPLNRDEYLVKIQKHCSELISEIVNYGTYILKWDIEVKRKGKDNNIPTLFFRNILELGDSISILVKESSIDPSKIILRTLIENILQLIYMLEEDEKQRALCYMVVKTNKDIKYYNKFIKSENSSKQFKIQAEKDELSLNFEKFMDHPEIIKAKKAKTSLLEKPEFSEIQQEYLNTSVKRKNPNWYSLFNGPKNLEQLAQKLKKNVRYEFFYRAYSENVHGLNLTKGMVYVGNGNAQIIQIRDFEHTQKVTFDTASLLLEIYNLFIKKRLPKKHEEYRIWYLTIRNDFLDLTKRNYINYKKE